MPFQVFLIILHKHLSVTNRINMYYHIPYVNIPRIFFPEFSEEKLGCTHYLKQGWYCSASKQMIPSRIKEWSANHMLSMAKRSRYRSFTAKEKLRIIEEQKTLETVQREESMMWAKVVFMTSKKKHTHTQNLERRIVIVGHFAARKRGIRNLKKGYAITWTIKDNMDAQLLMKCANWKF